MSPHINALHTPYKYSVDKINFPVLSQCIFLIYIYIKIYIFTISHQTLLMMYSLSFVRGFVDPIIIVFLRSTFVCEWQQYSGWSEYKSFYQRQLVLYI